LVDMATNLETKISSSLGNCPSIFEFTFTKASSFKETEQHVEKYRVQVQNQKDDKVAYIWKENIFKKYTPWLLVWVISCEPSISTSSMVRGSSIVEIEKGMTIWPSPYSYT
jgi:hypothetical protein